MQLLDRVPSQDLRVLVTGMLVQKETGGNLAEILDRIAHVIRERIRIHGEIRTHTAQGRLTGWILCLLPVVMLGLINFINPGYSDVLFNTHDREQDPRWRHLSSVPRRSCHSSDHQRDRGLDHADVFLHWHRHHGLLGDWADCCACHSQAYA